MNKLLLLIRYILFCIFFAVGAGAIVLSILIEPDIAKYFSNQKALEQIRNENEQIIELTEKYQAQIDLVRREPNVLARLEKATFGTNSASAGQEGIAVPQGDNLALRQAADRVLAEIDKRPPETPLPDWFQRCRQPEIRKALFWSGAGLVLITFIFFGTTTGRKHVADTSGDSE